MTAKNAPALKRAIGSTLVKLCAAYPNLRPFLASYGLRTSKDWFAGRIVPVPLPWGGRIKLASFSRNYLSFELFWKGLEYYEPITTLLARRMASESALFLDVGANIGYYSLVLAATEPLLRVIAFEPNPYNFALLQENVEANALIQVHCESLALSDADTTAKLFLSASAMSASLCPDFDAHLAGVVPVQTRTLDSYFAARSLYGPLLIKVDVEGHEAAFFRGASETIRQHRPDIIAEVALPFAVETTEFLKTCGYRFYSITDRGLLESAELRPVVRGSLVFLNYLLSARPLHDINAWSHDIQPAVSRLDLQHSSKFLPPAALREFKARIKRLDTSPELDAASHRLAVRPEEACQS